MCLFQIRSGDQTNPSQYLFTYNSAHFVKHYLSVCLVCAFMHPFHTLFYSPFHMTTLCHYGFFLSFTFINSALSWSVLFLSIVLILFGPLTAQPNYNTFLIFLSLFASTLSSAFTSLSYAFHLLLRLLQCRPELHPILDKVVFVSLWR